MYGKERLCGKSFQRIFFPKVFWAIQKKYAVIWAYNCSKGLAPLPGTPNIISPAFAKDLPVSPARIRSSLRFALRRKTSDRTIKTTKAIMHRSNIPAEYEFLASSEKHFSAQVSNWGSTASFGTVGSFTNRWNFSNWYSKPVFEV